MSDVKKTHRYAIGWRILGVAAVMILGNASGLQIQDYSSARHDRFSSGYPSAPVPNPDFIGAGFDWSGVGWDSSNAGKAVALISPRHFVCANHYKPSGKIVFRTRKGDLETHSVARFYKTEVDYYGTMYTSDLCLGELVEPVSDDVSYYPVLQPQDRQWFRYQPAYVYGKTARVGTNQTVQLTFSNFTYTVAMEKNDIPDEAHFESGDSGSPSFIVLDGRLTVLGTHMGVNSMASYDTFIFHYLDQLNSHMAPDYAVATLDPEASNPIVSFTAASQTVSEGVGTVAITVALSATSTHDVTIPLAVGGTATEGVDADYLISTTFVTIPSGSLSTDVNVMINSDSESEADETVEVTMWTPTNAIRGEVFEHTVTIQDSGGSPSLPTVEFASASQSANEGDGSVTVIAQLSQAADSPVSVPFTLSGSADQGSSGDYTCSASPLVFAAGSISASITLTLNDDAVDEFTESVVLTLGTPSGASLGSVIEHIMTLEDNDATPPGNFDVDNNSTSDFRDFVFCNRHWDANIADTVPSAVALPAGETEASVDSRIAALLVVLPDGYRALDVDLDGTVDARDFTFIDRRMARHSETVPDGMTLPPGVTETDLNMRIDALLMP